MTQKCFYEILNIPRTADLNTIKKSYKKLALLWHPDKNPNNKTEAEIMFKSISQAYEVLSDDAKRRIYDQHGHDGVNGNWRAPAASQTFDDDDDDSGRFDIFDLHDIFTFRDPHDIFREFFGTDPFDSIFGLASPFFDQSSSMIGGRMRRSNNLRQTRLNRHCQPYNVTTSAGGTGASRPASSHSQHDSSLSSAQQMCSPADILSPFSFGLGFMGGPFAGAFGGHHAASLFNMGPSMIDPGFGMFAATAAAANHHQHQYQSQGWAGSGASYRSTSTSTRIVNGKRVKTTKVVENGSETVTEEVDGIVVNKTVNGRSVAIAN